MAGLIARLFGGQSRPPDTDPLPGQGGYAMPPGRTGEGGYPGSTSRTRTLRGLSPREAKIRADRDSGWDSGLGSQLVTRQASYRGDQAGAAIRNPRATERVPLPAGRLRQDMQETPGTLLGGPLLRTGPGNQTAGGTPGRTAAAAGGHAMTDTETPASRTRDVTLAVGVPGSANVRNTIAQRYRNRPGSGHAYLSAPRPDQAPPNPGGQATDGNVHPGRVVELVTVINRFVFRGGGHEGYAFARRMPYTGRGDGARGADLNGSRYYATGQSEQFFNAGAGNYGIARQEGSGRKTPVSFTQPAPWSSNYYLTTESVESTDPAQAPNLVQMSPQAGRASNSTGRS